MVAVVASFWGVPEPYRWIWLPILFFASLTPRLFQEWQYRRKGLPPPRWSWENGFRWRDLIWFVPMMAGLIYLRFR